VPLSEIAVLYRTHIQSRPLEEAFIRAGVPHVAGCAGPHACHVIHRVVYRCPPGHPSRGVPVPARSSIAWCTGARQVIHRVVYLCSPCPIHLIVYRWV